MDKAELLRAVAAFFAETLGVGPGRRYETFDDVLAVVSAVSAALDKKKKFVDQRRGATESLRRAVGADAMEVATETVVDEPDNLSVLLTSVPDGFHASVGSDDSYGQVEETHEELVASIDPSSGLRLIDTDHAMRFVRYVRCRNRKKLFLEQHVEIEKFFFDPAVDGGQFPLVNGIEVRPPMTSESDMIAYKKDRLHWVALNGHLHRRSQLTSDEISITGVVANLINALLAPHLIIRYSPRDIYSFNLDTVETALPPYWREYFKTLLQRVCVRRNDPEQLNLEQGFARAWARAKQNAKRRISGP